MGIARRRLFLGVSAQRAVTEERATAYARVGQQLYKADQNEGSSWAVRDSNIRTAGGLAIGVSGEGYATGDSNIWTFPVGGSYTTLPCTGTPVNLCVSSGSEYMYYAVNAGSGWQTGYSTTIYKKVGVNGTPTAVKTFNTWDQANVKAVCSETGKDIIIGGKTGFTNCFRSTDYGATWSETAATQSAGAGCNQVDMSNDGKVCMVAMSDGLWFSTTGPTGLAKTGSANIMSCAVSGDGNTCYYVTGNTLYRSFDRGKSWVNLGYCGTPLKLQTSYLGEKLLTYDTEGIYTRSAWGTSEWTRGLVTTGVSDIVMNKFRK